MDYYTILNLDREPFSNSPDPNFFYQSRQHVDCLQKLELALRLKRGLNIVIGAVGAGKTTLCRTLLNKFSPDNRIEAHLILDPSFNSPLDFLGNICSMIVGQDDNGITDEHSFKEQIKHFLYQKGVDEKKTIILIIDEGQKLPVFCLEILRELLNYETNEHKLLQIVLFAQEEFQQILDHQANLADRVNLIHYLGPMDFADTREMINFRVSHASHQPRPPKLFTHLALRAIYRATGGYPRKIINLCHQCMLALIVQNRSCVDWRLVRSCTDRSLSQRIHTQRKSSRALVFSALAIMVTMVLTYMLAPGLLSSIPFSVGGLKTSSMLPTEKKVSVKPIPTPSPDTAVDSKENEGKTHPVVPISPSDEVLFKVEKKRQLPIAAIADVVPETPDESVSAEPKSDAITTDTEPKTAVVSHSTPPTLLGALTVKKNDTLGHMVKIVYGDFRLPYLQAVLDANPHIDHADAIRVGDTIAFPAIQATFVKRSYPLWWLIAEESLSLEEAYRRAIKLSAIDDGPLLRVISSWDNQKGLKFEIVVAGYFFNQTAAEHVAARFPDELGGSSTVISGWSDETVLFSDPFLGRGY